MPDQLPLHARIYWQYLLQRSVRHAQRIIAVSEQTRAELTSYWGIETGRIRVVHVGLRPSLRYKNIPAEEIQSMRQRYGDRYVLHVGRIVPRKNVDKLVQAFDLLASRITDLQLVLAGGAGHGSASVIRQIEASPNRERIHQAGWVPEQDLGPLYAGASALVFPSTHEGFGIPTVEAMACGTPVVASPQAASTEIGGEAVVRTDCSDPILLAGAVERVLTDAPLREHLIQLGRMQAQPFTCEACASATRQAYSEALANATHGKRGVAASRI
jgi:glycosyltransferase involved in cell wall biosynthesis